MRDKAGAGCRFEAELIKAKPRAEEMKPAAEKVVTVVIKRQGIMSAIKLIRKRS